MLAWLSVDTWLITLLALGYLGLLFVIAYRGEHQSSQKWLSRPWVYSLSLGVSCTSWAFYGMVGQVAESGAILAPVYIGTILCFTLAWPMLLRMLRISKEQNLTSIADFIACRYDKSPQIAATVAIVAIVGMVPYIALQLRAISTSFDLLTGSYRSGITTAFGVTLVLIVFSILFGTRKIAASKQNQGLVLAIAFSSIVKLIALTAVGVFVTFYLFDGFGDLLSQRQQVISAPTNNGIYLAVAQAILGVVTVFVLPMQFHMMVIENNDEAELRKARWLYPLFLVLMNLFVLPIAIAGLLTFPGGSVDADTFVLSIPLFHQQAWLGIVAFIGGLAASTAMVIVASIVLSTMVTTEVVTPLMLRWRASTSSPSQPMSGMLIFARRIAIATILMLAFLFDRLIDQQSHLASIGLLSFVLLAQFAPAIVGAMYWRKATTKGALLGLLSGASVWLYTLLLPTMFADAAWVEQGFFGLAWLVPNQLFGFTGFDNISHGVFFSLLANIFVYCFVSLVSHRSVGEKLQAEVFVHKNNGKLESKLTVSDLHTLLYRFTDHEIADTFLTRYNTHQHSKKAASASQLDFTETELAGVLGSASTRIVMKAAIAEQEMPLEDVVSIVDEASQLFQFNRELLQAGVENIEQGISVVDADMRLVAWNKRYIELLNYPKGLVKAGVPIESLLRFNAERGVIAGQDPDEICARRIAHMKSGTSHYYQRTLPNGVVLEIRGQAMPGGGFVSTFSDITAHIEAEKALQRVNESLENRVQQRTQELQTAKAQAEAANSSKTRFLAAASHDLMQPFNALSLFTSMLKQKVADTELAEIATNIDDSLNVVESLLSDLVEISRLDSSKQQPQINAFALDDLLSPLVNEFQALAAKENIQFNHCASQCWVETDIRLLRRIIQNFLSNAFHYCRQGKVLLGVRRQNEHLLIEVWDNGVGIPTEKQSLIFEEFERLEQTREVPGLGLGLAICERIAKLLGLTISLHSVEGKGTCFRIAVPRVNAPTNSLPEASPSSENVSKVQFNLPVLLIDNDDLMLKAMATQLQEWGCDVLAAKNRIMVEELLLNSDHLPQLVIADYHLDDNQNGVDLVQDLLQTQQWQIPCIICSADPSEAVRSHTSAANFRFVRKPIKSLALKKLIKQLSSDEVTVNT